MESFILSKILIKTVLKWTKILYNDNNKFVYKKLTLKTCYTISKKTTIYV